jgi:hypothetical protein
VDYTLRGGEETKYLSCGKNAQVSMFVVCDGWGVQNSYLEVLEDDAHWPTVINSFTGNSGELKYILHNHFLATINIYHIFPQIRRPSDKTMYKFRAKVYGFSLYLSYKTTSKLSTIHE